MIAQHLAPVVSVVPVAPAHFVLTCHAPALANAARPGCFVNVKADGEGFDPLLRKPFSIYAADKSTGNISLLFSVVGATTRTMARKSPGDLLDMVGPLGGNVFTPDPRPGVHHICVGGGYGVPPLVFLAGEIRQNGPHPPTPSPVRTGEGEQKDNSYSPSSRLRERGLGGEGLLLSFLIGARTRDLLLCERELRDAGYSTFTATDDGSCGFRGLVTDRLATLLDAPLESSVGNGPHPPTPSPVRTGEGEQKDTSGSPSTRLRERGLGGEGYPSCAVYCCGPTPMMRAVAALCLERGAACQVSMEVAMPCGVGVCMGCVLDLTDGRRVRCCTDGPVFGAEQVRWDA